MKELTKFEQWEELLNFGEFAVFISKSSCDSCKEIEKKIEDFEYKNIFKISLDNYGSFNLRKEINWIRKEVEILPFIGIISREVLVKKFQGNEVQKALTFLHSNRALDSE